MVPCTFSFMFHGGSRRLVLIIFRTSYKEKTAGSAHVSRLSFRFYDHGETKSFMINNPADVNKVLKTKY